MTNIYIYTPEWQNVVRTKVWTTNESLIERSQTKEIEYHVYSFLLFVSSRPHYQAECGLLWKDWKSVYVIMNIQDCFLVAFNYPVLSQVSCVKWWVTTSERLENVALFLKLGIPSTLIRTKNGAFPKRSSNRGNLKTLGLRFSVGGKHFKKGGFRKTITSRY